jgi:hypothetical protein
MNIVSSTSAGGHVRVEGSATTISWIPSEAITGLMKAGFRLGVSHYDSAPPDQLGGDIPAHLDELRAGDRMRFANHLHAWAEFSADGQLVDAGQDGSGHLGATHLRLGGDITVAAVAMSDLRPAPETGPFVQFRAPVAWSTLEVTLHADGRIESRLAGASPFPRHWVYDEHGALTAKSGTTDWKEWTVSAFGKGTPWGDEDSPAFVMEVESALERELSGLVMRGATKPRIRRLEEGEVLTRQGDAGDRLFLLLDGVLVVDVDGKQLSEIGPGAVLGERAVLEDGRRTSTLIARTKCKVAVVPSDQLDRDRLAELAAGHRREDPAADDIGDVDLLTAVVDAARSS